MFLFDWDLWHYIYEGKKGRSLERWALRYLHSACNLHRLALGIKILTGTKYSLEISSIWIDGTPQAHGVARTKSVKCELADLLYIIEECDADKNVINKKALLLQGKNTRKFNKIDGGSSTKKERALFEKLDRKRELVLKSGVSDSSRKIGSYVLGGTLSEGLSDCAKFLLMPKSKFWESKSAHLFPFHVTWTKSEKTADMKIGVSLDEATLNMLVANEIGKPVVDPKTCEWSRLVTDLEKGYLGVTMNGYGGQKRVNSSLFIAMDEQGDMLRFSNSLNGHEEPAENVPFISIIRIKVIDRSKD
ncbi:hypothetical protein [Granulosicoccus antarcticus]|uniref:Uncharacterized protein n=1 Tax=Granulosicoccus antarcticus IMCC3135 TaxID=1192854 RepID=A0A2Z2NY34_9GAMM|nr:hypothetical protein [Granulosicoccus antarcticus]ASJ76199.1 hypothetical protein IMCC3135_30750 [Granulosicoccus antarcticus IMCC3135]